jgi:molybdate transport system ATP-binding protein
MSGLALRYQQQLGEQRFDIDLVLPERGISVIFGRSGSGKTSIVNVIAGLNQPDEGSVYFNGAALFDSAANTNIPVHQRNIGYVFQDARLFPHYTVKGNLHYGMRTKDDDHFDQVVSLLALTHLLERYPNQLSGGEKQRVAIGRALLSRPKILLMDEPLASLDLPRKREVLPFLEQLSHTVDIPIIYVSHSLNEVLRLANHLVVIEDGRVAISGGVADVWSSNAMRPWQSFSDQSSLFEGSVETHNDEYALSQVKLAEGTHLWVQKVELPVSSPVRLQVRANDVSIALTEPAQSSIRNILPATISKIEVLEHGKERQNVMVELRLADECYLWASITAWSRDELALVKGMSVYVQIKGVSVTQRDVMLSQV